MSIYPSDKLRKLWRPKFVDLERRMLAYYRERSTETPDGSFLMGAFLDGFASAMRAVKKQEKKR